MRRVLVRIIETGTVPIIATIAQIACEYNIPL